MVSFTKFKTINSRINSESIRLSSSMKRQFYKRAIRIDRRDSNKLFARRIAGQ